MSRGHSARSRTAVWSYSGGDLWIGGSQAHQPTSFKKPISSASQPNPFLYIYHYRVLLSTFRAESLCPVVEPDSAPSVLSPCAVYIPVVDPDSEPSAQSPCAVYIPVVRVLEPEPPVAGVFGWSRSHHFVKLNQQSLGLLGSFKPACILIFAQKSVGHWGS